MSEDKSCYRCACGEDENDDWRLRWLKNGRKIICGECDDTWCEEDDEWDAELDTDSEGENEELDADDE